MNQLSDRIIDQGFDVCMAGWLLAEKLPKGWIRFAATVLLSPTIFVTGLLSIPWLLVGVLVMMWEDSTH